jgi:phosphoribosyl-ATP pyrophosphohydrolase
MPSGRLVARVSSERQEIAMADERFLAQLWATIESRKADEAGGRGSYTQELLRDPPKIRRKIIEEAYEVNESHQALDAGRDTKDHLAHEAADLLYHLFVLLASADVTPTEVYTVLERRHRPQPGGGAAGGTP